MRSPWLCGVLLLVAGVAGSSVGKSADAPAAAAPAGGEVVDTKAGTQASGGEQQTRFGPGLIGAVVNAGASLLHSAVGGGHQPHIGGNQFGGGGFHGQTGGFGQPGSFGPQGQFGGGFGGRPVRPGGFGGFGGRPSGLHRPVIPGGFQGTGQGGGRPGGFPPGGFQQGGFIGSPHQGGFGGGFGGAFGGQKGGACPPVRASCPTRSNIGPTPCISDFSCPGVDKCCPDTCLKSTVCKPPEKF